MSRTFRTSNLVAAMLKASKVEATVARRHIDGGRHPRGNDRRVGPAPATYAHDGDRRDGRTCPDLVEHGPGVRIMKPIAAPIIGGMVKSTIHVLIITPRSSFTS